MSAGRILRLHNILSSTRNISRLSYSKRLCSKVTFGNQISRGISNSNRTATTVAASKHAQTSNVKQSKINNELKIEESLDFNDFEKAFRAKTTWDIVRALMVYKACSFDTLVENNRSLINLSRRLLGKKGFEFMMKNSFYGHFVAGETQPEIKSYLSLMKSYGVGAILDYAVEADIPQSTITESATTDKVQGDEEDINIGNIAEKYQIHKEFADRRDNLFSARTYFYEGEEKCDENMEVFLKCIDTTSATSDNGFAAIKITALGRPVLLLRLSQILLQTQQHFDKLAADNHLALTEREIAEDTFEHGLKDLGVHMSNEEAKHVFDIIDTSKNGRIDIYEWHNFLTPRLKLGRLFRAKPLQKDKLGEEILATLTDTELKEMENMTDRLLTVCQRAKEKNVRLMVDAEQTYFQPAISRITLEAMRWYNQDKPIIFNTYQCYLKDTPNNLRIDMELARREGFNFSCKLVRGAYMEQERDRAETFNYKDPIHMTKEDTHQCYDDMLLTMLEEVRDRGANVMIASHNENSIHHAIETMNKFGIKRSDENVFFGQLLGMCDAITYALGGADYAAFKYVPYGPVSDVIPYLSRRAMENKSVMLGVVKERQMLWDELSRRFKGGRLKHDPWEHVSASS